MYNIKNITSREVFRGFRAQTIHHSIFCNPEAGYAGYIPEERTHLNYYRVPLLLPSSLPLSTRLKNAFFFSL